MKRNGKKNLNTEAKTSLQQSSKKRKVNSRCRKDYKPIKKDKDKANWEYLNRDKAKSHNPFLANTNQF